MNNDEKIVQKVIQALEALQEGQKAIRADVRKQGKQLEALNAEVKGLSGKVDTVELKVETIHAYQIKAHDEIMDHLFVSNEANGQVQKELEKRIARIEKHLA